MAAEAKQLLLQNRDSDAARLTQIRETAKQMLAKKKSPKKILAYMTAAATEFVQSVVFDYIRTMGLADESIVVLSTGAVVKGELFPYSDLDVQVMKSGMDRTDPNQIKMMDLLLDNIKLRVRLASMKEDAGMWKSTQGWDLDQLVDRPWWSRN